MEASTMQEYQLECHRIGEERQKVSESYPKYIGRMEERLEVFSSLKNMFQTAIETNDLEEIHRIAPLLARAALRVSEGARMLSVSAHWKAHPEYWYQ